MPSPLQVPTDTTQVPPLVSTPDWLLNLTKETIEQGPLPLLELLRGSVYYPAAGTDGHDVQVLSPYSPSFVHVDYSCGENKIRGQLHAPHCFFGYALVGLRWVGPTELTPQGWRPTLRNPEGHRALPSSANASNSFALWAVYERESTYGPSHGAERFSLLHLHADGVAAYDALYRGNDVQARFLAIINPSEGYGDGWTRFTEPGNFLHQLVMGNPQGTPAYLLYGDFASQPCWPEFEQLVQEKTLSRRCSSASLQLWSRPARAMGGA